MKMRRKSNREESMNSKIAMMPKKWTLVIPILCWAMLGHALTGRERINFDEDWFFHLNDTSRWDRVSVPHDWEVELPPVPIDKQNGAVGHGFKLGGIGYYKKYFTIPQSDMGRKITIEFDGVYRNSDMWLNGHYLGNHKSGYVPCNYDLTDVVNYGEEGTNLLVVKVNPNENEGWWYEGAGIYRHVWLNKTDRLHVARFGTYVTTPEVTEKSAKVNMQIEVENEYNTTQTFSIVSYIEDSEGKKLSKITSKQELAPLSKECVIQQGTVAKPRLWSPETPELYRLRTEIWKGNSLCDTYLTPFGIRYFEFTPKGFFLNGKPSYFKGTCNHQDFAGVGTALPDKIHVYRVELLKEMGSNAYRMSHNPPTPELLDCCDSLGMMVMDEHRTYSSCKFALEDLKTLILRDRNHPSVIIWSLENEEKLEGTPKGVRIATTMHDFVRKLDPSRPTTGGLNHGWNECGYGDIYEVVGYNYGQRDSICYKDHKAYPERCMIGTESTSYVTTRGEYAYVDPLCYVSNQSDGVGWGCHAGIEWRDVLAIPALSGTFVWTGFDYRGEPTPYSRWPCVVSHFGILDLCGFPKDDYYIFKAMWKDEPLVHAFPNWNLKGKEGMEVEVWCYTNCEEVEFWVNGQMKDKKKATPCLPVKCTLTYEPGKLEVKGYKNGEMVTHEVSETTGDARSIALQGSCTELKADAKDVVVVNVSLLDEKGRVSHFAEDLVEFSVTGPARIIGVGNGNPSSHEPEKAPYRKAFHGLCQVILQSTHQAGDITLHAKSQYLKGADISFSSKP